MNLERRNPRGENDSAELAELYVAGALTEPELQEFELRMRSGDVALRAEVDRLRPVLEALLDGGQADVPTRLRERIETTVMDAGRSSDDGADDFERTVKTEQVFTPVRAAEGDTFSAQEAGGPAGLGLVILRASEGRWRATGIRGVRYRTLLADRRSNRRTVLLRMDPGSRLPDHDHSSVEEIYLVSGDLAIGDQTLRQGDYFRVEPGARHGVPISPNGCVCIVISGYVPFPLASWFAFAWTAMRGLFSTHPKP